MQPARPYIKVENYNGNILHAQSIHCENIGFNARYSITIEATIKWYLNPVLFNKARILFCNQDVHGIYHAELLSYEEVEKTAGETGLSLHFGSSLHRLDNVANERYYVNKTIKEIVTQLLAEYRIKPVFAFKHQTRRLPYIVQGGVSDYAFLVQLCSEHGVVFYYSQEQNEAKLYFTEETYAFKQYQFAYNQQNGLVDTYATISHLIHRLSRVPENVRLRGAEEGAPDATWEYITENTTDILGSGLVNLYALGLVSQDDCEQQANCLQKQLNWQREWFQMEAVGPVLQAGDCLTITGHPDVRINRSLRVLSLSNSFAISEKGESYPFRQQVFLIRHDTPYRMPVENTRIVWNKHVYGDAPEGWQPAHKRPNPSLQVASIAGEKDEVLIDAEGKYYIYPLLDKSPRAVGRHSHPVRQLQPAAGPKGKKGAQGMHFPLSTKTRVIIGHLDNLINKPFILGVLPDREQPNVVSANNHNQLAIRHKFGSALMVNDTEAKQAILLHTQDDKHNFILNKNIEDEAIQVNSIGSLQLRCEKKMHLKSWGSLTLNAETSSWQAGKEFNIWVKKNIMVTMGDKLGFWAANDWLATAQKGAMDCNAEKKLLGNAKIVSLQSTELCVKSTDANASAKQTFNITAKKEIRLNAASSALRLSGGTIDITVPTLKLLASLILKNHS